MTDSSPGIHPDFDAISAGSSTALNGGVRNAQKLHAGRHPQAAQTAALDPHLQVFAQTHRVTIIKQAHADGIHAHPEPVFSGDIDDPEFIAVLQRLKLGMERGDGRLVDHDIIQRMPANADGVTIHGDDKLRARPPLEAQSVSFPG